MLAEKDNVLANKSMAFAKRIYHFAKYLNDKKEFDISHQVLRSGTSIGANVAEANFAESSVDFAHKLSVSRKEANETLFWLQLLRNVDVIDENMYESMRNDCVELVRLLTASIKTSQANSKRKE